MRKTERKQESVGPPGFQRREGCDVSEREYGN